MDVGEVLVWFVFVTAAVAFVVSAVAVISFSNPFYSALALIGKLRAQGTRDGLYRVGLLVDAERDVPESDEQTGSGCPSTCSARCWSE